MSQSRGLRTSKPERRMLSLAQKEALVSTLLLAIYEPRGVRIWVLIVSTLFPSVFSPASFVSTST